MGAFALICALAGCWLVMGGVTRLRQDPIARALDGHPLSGRRRTRDPLERLMTRLDRLVGGREGALVVLARDPADHRRRQLFAGAVGATVSVWVASRGTTATSVVWSVVAMAAALAWVEWDLLRSASRRRRVLAGQVVALAEFLALGVTAGLTVSEALDRAGRFVAAPLQPWLQALSADIRSGRSLQRAATETAEVMAVPAFTRLVQAVLTATERGTPLAQTLIAQAADQRSEAQARELERAGQAEIGMLVPIVFLVLPAVVAVAVYPGFVSLTSM